MLQEWKTSSMFKLLKLRAYRGRLLVSQCFWETGEPVLKNLSCNAGEQGQTPGWRTKIPHAVEQLSLCAAATEPVKLLGRVRLFAVPWTVACQAPPSMAFSRQECSSGSLFPSPGDLPNLGIEPRSSALQTDSLPTELPGKPGIQCCKSTILQQKLKTKQISW